MREQRLKLNTFTSLVFQLAAVICGFILPRLIIGQYGSEVNGLLNSITQFLGVVNFIELGVGAVVQSSLYEPLAEKNNDKISKVIKSASGFYCKIASLFIIYAVVLLIIYPFIGRNDFERVFTMLLIVVMFISSFAQNYFGIVERLLLSADQRGYVQYTLQTISIVLNTLLSACLIFAGASIIAVKLVAALIFVVQPIFLKLYVRRNYSVDRRVTLVEEPIKQKWNGLAQHVAAVILDSTDTIILTVFSSLSNVSIYSVYHLVIYGVKNLFAVMTNGIQSYWGDMWAKNENVELNDTFMYYEWLIHMGSVLVFGCTGVLVVPFVKIYTSGVTDANYIVPAFAALITIAHGTHCLRLPYHVLIKSVGHYKQTQKCYIIAVVLNLFISIITVKLWGLIGVAIGTLIAMLYQTVWMAYYDYRKVLSRKIKFFYKLIALDVVIVLAGCFVSELFSLKSISYFSWVELALKDFFTWLLIVICSNFLIYRDNLRRLLKSVWTLKG